MFSQSRLTTAIRFSSSEDETSSEEEDEAEEDVIEFPDEQRSDVPLGDCGVQHPPPRWKETGEYCHQVLGTDVFPVKIDDTSSEEEDEAEEDVIEFPDEQRSDVPLGEVTNRIAVVNLDWENSIRSFPNSLG
jgi:hypothetical protein